MLSQFGTILQVGIIMPSSSQCADDHEPDASTSFARVRGDKHNAEHQFHMGRFRLVSKPPFAKIKVILTSLPACRLAAAKHVLKTHLRRQSYIRNLPNRSNSPLLVSLVKLNDQAVSNREPQVKLYCPIFRGLARRSCTSLAGESWNFTRVDSGRNATRHITCCRYKTATASRRIGVYHTFGRLQKER
jgi:hypothetical protein